MKTHQNLLASLNLLEITESTWLNGIHIREMGSTG